MSSSSSAVRWFSGQDRSEDDRRCLARILAGIAHECSLLGNDVSRIGDVLSDLIAGTAGGAEARELQGFDALAQNAHAQAKLIAHLTRVVLQGRGGSLNELIDQIEDVPLAGARRRLRAAIGAPASAARTDDDEVELWMEELGFASDTEAGG